MIFIRKEENAAYWQKKIEEQITSGKRQQAWCDEVGINVNTFRYWKRKIEASKQLGDDFLKENRFVAVKKSTPTNDSKSSIKVSISSATIEVDASTDFNLFDDVVKVLIKYA